MMMKLSTILVILYKYKAHLDPEDARDGVM